MYPRTASATGHSSDAKRTVLPYLPTDSKVIATASARVYHAPFGEESESWTFSGLSGVLVFGRDRLRLHPDRKFGTGPGTSFEHKYWFRLIDLASSKGLVWMHQIPQYLDYRTDKPFFHVFQAKTRMFGFRFDEDGEASKFHKKVASHIRFRGPTPTRKDSKRTSGTNGSPKRVSPAMISSPTPNSFIHVNHVGFGEKGNIIVSDDIEPGWTIMMEELQGYGVTEKMVRDDTDFVDGFMAGVRAVSPKEAKLGLGLDIRTSSRTTPQSSVRSSPELGSKRKVVRRKPVTPFV